jgi:hypothetical protein
LAPYGVRVVDLKTGAVKTNFFANNTSAGDDGRPRLPEGSLYEPIKETVEKTLNGADFEPHMADRHTWAKGVVSDLIKSSPPSQVWRGGTATIGYLSFLFPRFITDFVLKSQTGLNRLAKIVSKR